MRFNGSSQKLQNSSMPEIDRKRGFEEILNSPIYKNYVISEKKNIWNCSLLKKDERLSEFIKVKEKYLNQERRLDLQKDEKRITKIP